MSASKLPSYCTDYFNRKRIETRVVEVGSISIGGSNPIRIQSMTTTDTMDTRKSVEQSIRMIAVGCEIVRLTAPSKKEAENLREIKNCLVEKGYSTPLVADIHFTPNAAEIAARIVEKVRINPGNYADKKRFEEIEYTDRSYHAELKRIEEKFTPLVLICKKEGTAIRIGTNHGSLSDRILSRYGDTPEGMVESAMEFLRVCIKNEFHSIVLSMKASNTLVMVQAYRLLVSTMKSEGMNYPLHLGVTEAGDGEDGRIKSAVGIGALLEDGLGDTIRVSLTEEPEAEIPVAQKIVEKIESSKPDNSKMEFKKLNYNPFHHTRRVTAEVMNIGDNHVPVVVADLSGIAEIKPSHLFAFGYHYSVPLDKWTITDSAADMLYVGNRMVSFLLPGTLKVLCSSKNWTKNYTNKSGFYPLVVKADLDKTPPNSIRFIAHSEKETSLEYLKDYPNAAIILSTENTQKLHFFREIQLKLAENNLKNPVILHAGYSTKDEETFQIWSSSDLGSAFIDGYGDGIWLTGKVPNQVINSTAFGILQATRSRISKTEYISCPSCGRTLFDLQETTAKIRSRTSHLKGLKIGIMGCIVNGPGEMADADYGYVGTRPGKIHLYKEQTVIKKNVDEKEAVDALIDLIQENGDWTEPKSIERY